MKWGAGTGLPRARNDSAELKLSPHPLGKEGSWRANPSLGSAKMPVAQKWHKIQLADKTPAHKNPATAKWLDFLGFFGRDGVIRTLDPLHPMQVRYQAALRPDCTSKLSGCASEVSRTIY